MMPRRWIELGSDATEVERSLLTVSPNPDPEPGEQERVWQALLASIPGPTDPDGGAGPTPAPSAPAGSAAQAPGALLVNHGLGFAVGVVTTTLVFLLVDSFHPSEGPAPTPPATPAATSAPRTVEGNAPGVPSTAIEALELEPSDPIPQSRPLPALPPRAAGPASAANPASAASQLSEEAALLREARSRLAHGDLQGASEVLATSKAKFPNSRLAQEREAATIELLRRSGDSVAAAARARAFLSRYPQSPHARQVERALPAHQDD